ncbi:MAG: ribonuclease P protein component [bacterium]|nr:ribonuclease P protein component [bacterium]
MPPYPLKKCQKILKRDEYLKIGADGIKIRSNHFIVMYKAKSEGACRVGITASKKVGNAVYRNRVKRLIREFFRLNHELFFPADMVFIAGRNSCHLTYKELSDELMLVFGRRGLIQSFRVENA